MSTGTGKSKVAIDFISTSDVTRILITSPRTNLKTNWKEELNKWGWQEWTTGVWSKDKKIVTIVIENIQTCYKWKKREFDLVIADEIHTMMTPEYSLLFKNNKFVYTMGLTATHDIAEDNGKQEMYDKHAPIIYEYYSSAEDGLINRTRYFIVDHYLNNTDTVTIKMKNAQFLKGEQEQYEYLTSRMKKGEQLMLAQGSTFWFTDAADWFWKGLGTPEQKYAGMMYLNSIKYRKEFLQSLPSTAKIARRIKDGILEADADTKVLIFSELTNQVEQITKSTYHSHNSATLNKQRMDDFNAGKIRVLGSCQSLTLGLNLKGATHAIMESYVGSKTRSKQKKGRLDRLKVGQIADMWIIRVKDTQAEKWFDLMSEDLIDYDLAEVITVNSQEILNGKVDYTHNKPRVNT